MDLCILWEISMCSVWLEFSAFICMSMLSGREQRVLMMRNIDKITIKRQSCRALLILVSHFKINFLVRAFCAVPKGRHNCFIRILMRRVLIVSFAAHYNNCYSDEFYILLMGILKREQFRWHFCWHFISPKLKSIYRYGQKC